MSVAVDHFTSSGNAVGVVSTTWTHTPVGTPTAVGVGNYGFGGFGGATVCTYGGVSVPRVATDADGNSDTCDLFGLASPLSGAQQVVLTFSPYSYPTGGSVTVTASDPATCFSNVAHAVGTNAAPTVNVTSAVGELVLCVAGQDGASGAPTENGSPGVQTNLWSEVNGGERGFGSWQPGAATVTMGYTVPGAAPWAICAGSFKAAGGGGGGSTFGPIIGGTLINGGALTRGRLTA